MTRGAVVSSFDATQLEGGINGAVNRLNLRYTSSGLTAPDSIIIKLPAADTARRERANQSGLYERETRFYTELVSSINGRTPIVYHAEMNLTAGDDVLLLEDLQHLRAGDQILGCGEQDARAAMRYLSALHSSWWNDVRLDSIPWLMRPGEAATYEPMATIYAQVVELALERLSNWLPADIEGIARRFVPAVPWFFQTVGSGPITLTHEDFRLANLFFSDDDKTVEVTALDLQFISAQRGAVDVAYFMFWSLNTEERRNIENGLLEEYHVALLTGGVRDYPYRDFIQDYRRGLFRNLLTLFDVVGNISDEALESGPIPATLEAMSGRMQALIDWDCGELLPD